MSINIDSKSQKVVLSIENLKKATETQLRLGLYDVGKQLRGTASENIKKKPRSGRIYKHKGRKHRASIPGESWANKSGEARRGLNYKVKSSTELEFGNTVEHAAYMEFGTKNIQPRPAHLIAIRENNRNIINILGRRIKKAIKGER
jgi:hypothetical protein